MPPKGQPMPEAQRLKIAEGLRRSHADGRGYHFTAADQLKAQAARRASRDLAARHAAAPRSTQPGLLRRLVTRLARRPA